MNTRPARELTPSEIGFLECIGRTAPDLYLAALVELETWRDEIDVPHIVGIAFKRMKRTYAPSSESIN
jgi:hypothetical protein